MRTDWVVWIGADDRFRPTALDGIERDDADVVALGFQYDTGQTWMPHPTRERVLRVEGKRGHVRLGVSGALCSTTRSCCRSSDRSLTGRSGWA